MSPGRVKHPPRQQWTPLRATQPRAEALGAPLAAGQAPAAALAAAKTAVTAELTIEVPPAGAVLDLSGPVLVRGKGAGLPERNVLVQALDEQGHVVAERAARLEGAQGDQGDGGTWSVQFAPVILAGSRGRIRAFALSPTDTSHVAETSVTVTYGAPLTPTLTITEPTKGALLDVTQMIRVEGTATGLPSNSVMVQAEDDQGKLVAQETATVQSRDDGAAGSGAWSVDLDIRTAPGKAGRILAFALSADGSERVAETDIAVQLGEPISPVIDIARPQSGAVLEIGRPFAINGTGAGLPDGNVVVRAVDAEGNVLAEQATVVKGHNIGTGAWTVLLRIDVPAGTAGQLVAFSPSPDTNQPLALVIVPVTFGAPGS